MRLEVPAKVVVYAVGQAGIGHAMRARRLAEHVVRGSGGPIEAVVVTGHAGAAAMLGESRQVRVRAPEAIRRLLMLGSQQPAPLEAVRDAAQALLDVLAEIKPDVVVSTSPSGLAGELRVAMASYQAEVRTVLLLRDIYHPPRYSESYDGVADRFDGVLIAGPTKLAQWTPRQVRHSVKLPVSYMGYLSPLDLPQSSAGPPRPGLPGLPALLRCQVGGGRDGSRVAAEVVSAFGQLGTANGAELHVDIGPFFEPAALERLHLQNVQGVTISAWTAYADKHLRAAVVSMAGYNSCVEAAWTGVRTLLWPRDNSEDREQMIRAKYFAGLFDNIEVFGGDLESLCGWLARHMDARSVESTPVRKALRGFYADPVTVAELVLRGGQSTRATVPGEDVLL